MEMALVFGTAAVILSESVENSVPPGCAVFERGWDLSGSDYYVGT